MAKRGRPLKSKLDNKALDMECLKDIEKESLSRLAYLYVHIYADAYDEILKLRSDDEAKKVDIMKAADNRMKPAADEIFLYLKENGINILPQGVGRPKSLDAILRITFANHATLQGKSLKEAFEMLSGHISKIPSEFGIRYPVRETTHLNHWRNVKRYKREVYIMEYFQKEFEEFAKKRFHPNCY